MRQYIVRRLILLVPVMVGVSLAVFLLLRVLPGDVATAILSSGGQGSVRQEDVAALRQKLGLDRPLHEQYLQWLSSTLQLDLGNSLIYDRPIVDYLGKRVPVTLELAALSMAVSLLIAIPVGVISSIRQDTWLDYFVRGASVVGLTMPTFWVGVLVILMLSLWLHWTPPLEYVNPLEDPVGNAQQMIFPAFVVGLRLSAVVSRMTRSQMLEVLREDYIRTALAKGLRERAVVFRHALKNAVLPVVTLSGAQLGYLLGGTVITETIFNLPGIGRSLVDAIFFRDYPVVQAIVVLMAGMVVLLNLVVDLLYAWLNPRIRYT